MKKPMYICMGVGLFLTILDGLFNFRKVFVGLLVVLCGMIGFVPVVCKHRKLKIAFVGLYNFLILSYSIYADTQRYYAYLLLWIVISMCELFVFEMYIHKPKEEEIEKM